MYLDLEDLSVENMSRDQIQSCPRLRSPFGTLACMWLCFSAFASSHHHHTMNFYHIFLLLLVILSAYSESPQHGKPPDSLDSTVATVCPNSSSDSLGVLAPVLPWIKVFESVQSQNMVLPQNEVFESVQSQNMVLPQNEVYILPQNEVFGSAQSQN